jgi:signal transduction histidine kinase
MILKRRRRSETDLVVRMMRKVRLDAGLRDTVQALADDLIRVLSARRILIAARETNGGRAFLWTVPHTSQDSKASLQLSEIAAVERESYFFAAPPSWCAVRRGRFGEADPFEIVCNDGEGEKLRQVPSRFIPHRFAALHQCRSCLTVSFEFGSEWTCRLFVLDAKLDRHQEGTLRLVRHVVRELSPAVYNVYLFHRLQTRAAATERATLARELHDGLIQSLISAEMRVHAVRRRLTEDSAAAELLRIEKILHEEVLGVRDLMQRIKPIHLETGELLEFLADHVQKFGSDTGIKATFSADVQHVSLPPPKCTEVARVVQEALSNVRKHSGAGSVSVHLSEAGHRWSLVIEDDGRGLGAIVVGGAPLRYPSPAVIKECVRSLDGELRLRSASGGGLRLEISFAGPATADETPLKQERTRKKMARVSPILHDGASLAKALVAGPAAHRSVRSSGQDNGRP